MNYSVEEFSNLITDAILVLNIDLYDINPKTTNVHHWNPAFEALFGGSIKNIEGLPFIGSLDSFYRNLVKCFEDRTTVIENISCTKLDQSQKEFYCEISLYPCSNSKCICIFKPIGDKVDIMHVWIQSTSRRENLE
jgi:hypothetical protein